jgi:DNA polymerase-3 subunit delta
MKLGARDIDGFLHDPKQAAGALIYGLDGGQVRQRVSRLADTFLGANADPMSKLELSSEEIEADPARLSDELASMSLMAPKRVIMVRDVDDKILAAIQQALELRSKDNFLILYTTDSLSRTKLREWAERSAAIAAVPCYKDEGANLDTLIRDTMRGYGLRIAPDALRYLSSQLGGDRQIILNELEKLSLYVGEEAEEVSLDDAAQVVGENNDRSLDDLSAAVAGDDMKTLCSLSDRLQAEGMVGLILVRALMRYFARLESLSLARASGQSLDAAIEALRPPVFFKAKPALKAHATRWNADMCADAIARLQILELDSKRFSDQSLSRLAHGFMDIAMMAGAARRAA